VTQLGVVYTLSNHQDQNIPARAFDFDILRNVSIDTDRYLGRAEGVVAQHQQSMKMSQPSGVVTFRAVAFLAEMTDGSSHL